MRRLGTPADIGNAVALLCSNEAAWITGQLIVVDGGMGLPALVWRGPPEGDLLIFLTPGPCSRSFPRAT